MERDGQEPIFDSRTIMEWADHQGQGPMLFRDDPEARWHVLSLEAVGNGILDQALPWLVETRMRPQPARYQPQIDAYRCKLHATLDWLEARIGGIGPERMVDVAQSFVETYGITTFKIKVGRNPYQLDIELCRALRRHFGDKVDLYIDGNRGWSSSDSARALRAMADLDLLFAEELNPADDVMGRRWRVRQAQIPFFADESVSRPAEVVRELLDGSATAVSIKTARTGFTQSQCVLFLAESLGVDTYIGNQTDGQLGTMASRVFGASYRATAERAAELSNYLDMSDDLLTEPLQIKNGHMQLRDLPSLGVKLDDSKLSHYRVDI